MAYTRSTGRTLIAKYDVHERDSGRNLVPAFLWPCSGLALAFCGPLWPFVSFCTVSQFLGSLQQAGFLLITDAFQWNVYCES